MHSRPSTPLSWVQANHRKPTAIRNAPRCTQERIALAEDEYLRGRAKLLAAGAQLRQLASQAKRYQGQALELSAEVRVLPADATKRLAPQLRGEVDAAFQLARKQRAAMEGQLKRIVNNGVYV